MFPSEIQFKLEKDPYDKTEKGWRYKVRLDGTYDWWVVAWWKSKPNQTQVDDTRFLIMRSIEIYHNALKVPLFTRMKVVGD